MLLAATSLLPHWTGVGPSEKTHGTTDYQRACAVESEIDTVDLAHAHAHALVLGDEPDRTAMFLCASDLFLVRWRWASSEKELTSALAAALDTLAFGRSGTFSTIPGEHRLFDSACPGLEIAQSSSVVLDADRYAMETAQFRPSSSVNALIHRLRRT